MLFLSTNLVQHAQAKAVAEMNQRDLQAQRDQEERHVSPLESKWHDGLAHSPEIDSVTYDNPYAVYEVTVVPTWNNICGFILTSKLLY